MCLSLLLNGQLVLWALNKTELVCLCDPGVFQTLCSCGSFLWQQLQHGREERAELDGFLSWPLVLIQEDLKHTPWLQLRDASQLSCTGQDVN